MRGAWRWAGAVCAAVVLTGCGGNNETDVCAGVACGAGHCVVDQGAAACLCDADFQAQGLFCVPRVVDPCAANPCVGLSRSLCVADAGVASCECPQGRIEIDGVCVIRTACTPNPCTVSERKTVCEVSGTTARCLCEPGYAPMGDGCATTPTWDCAAQHSGPDEDTAEPSECPPLAWQLVVGTPSEDFSVRPAGDQDWFALPTLPGHVYAVYANVVSGPSTLQLEVFDHAGLTVLAADTAGDGTAEVHFRAPANGPQLARVRGQRASDVFTYSIRYEDQGVDDYPNVADEAPPLSPGATFDGELQYPGDLDLAWLTLPSATAVRIDMQGLDAGADLVVDLRRADGGLARTLAWERTTVTVPEDDAVLLVARGRNLHDVGRFFVATADLGVDDHSDEPAFATPIQPSSTPQPATFERVDDRDVVRFHQEGGHIYQVSCALNVSSYYGCQAQALTPAGGPLDSSGSTAPVWLAKTTQDVVATFTRQTGSPGGATYTWFVDDLGRDDYPNPPAAGAPITPGTAVAGRLELPDDADAFSFTADAGHIINVTASATGSQLQVAITTLSGQELAQNINSATAFVQLTGTYQVTVKRSYSYTPGVVPYSVVVSDLGADDHANQSSLATPITLGQVATGDIQYAGDTDWFSVPVTANHVYQASCLTAAGACPMQIVDPSGMTVTSYFTSSVRGFLASQSGVAAFGVQGQYSAVGPYTLTVVDLGPEDHGATLATATACQGLCTATPGNIGYIGDFDVFSFAATAGHIYAVTCAGPASCPVSVLNAAGTVVASSSSSTSDARALAATTGPLYVRVGDSYSTSVYAYTLTVTDVGLDDHANTAAGATPIALDTAVTGERQYQGDVDVLAFTAVVGRLYQVQCTATSGQCALAVRAGTTTVAQAYQATTATVGFEAPATDLAIEVTSSATASWSVLVTDLGVDDHGDTPATGTPLTLGAAATTGRIEVPNDVDVFTLANVAANDVVLFTCASTSGCRVDARGPSGVQVASDSSYGSAALRLGFRAPIAGTYSFSVTPYSSGTTMTYTVSAAAGTDDHGDTAATATALTLGTGVAGVIDFASDVDAFTVTLPAGTQRTVTLTGNGVRASVYAPGGGYVGAVYSYSSFPLSFTPGTAGSYVIQVSRDSSTAGGYVLTVN